MRGAGKYFDIKNYTSRLYFQHFSFLSSTLQVAPTCDPYSHVLQGYVAMAIIAITQFYGICGPNR
jgi:hypothetical protein